MFYDDEVKMVSGIEAFSIIIGDYTSEEYCLYGFEGIEVSLWL